MKTFKRIIVPGVLLIAAALSTIGCGAGSPQTTPLTPKDIAANAVTAYQNVKTLKMGMNMTMAMNVEGGKEPMKVDMKASATGSMDLSATRMNMVMDVDMTVPVAGNQKTSTEMYIVDNWLYMKVSIPKVGDQWAKIKLSPEMWKQQNQLDQQINMLKTAIEVTSAGEETVDGVPCYVLSIKPDMGALAIFLESQLGQSSAGDTFKDVDLAKMFKSFAVKEWIGKQDYLPVKMDVQMSLQMQPGDVGAKSTDFTGMTLDMSIQGKYFDYNKPVTITLPAGASTAKETPSVP